MPISVKCSACGRGHKAPDAAAGKTFKCLACGEPMLAPPVEIDPAAILLGDGDDAPVPATEPAPSPPEPSREFVLPQSPVTPVRQPLRRETNVASLPPLTTNDPPFWRRHLHWLLVFAMLPLATSLLSNRDRESEIESRLFETLEDVPPESQERVVRMLAGETSLDDLLNALPRHRLRGAWLPRDTYAHWGMAAGATIFFLLFFMFLASDGSAGPLQVLAVGLFTATIGVGFLILVQALASLTDGHVIMGRSVLVIVFIVLKFIAFSYGAADDPENGFFMSFLGFTMGVGLMEELVKTVPLFRHSAEKGKKNWRGLLIWGLASGAGFGIAEGILYSSRYYNGICPPSDYLVRFMSCVALHAIWSGSVGITLYLRRDLFDKVDAWYEWIPPLLVVIGIPMLLHGLYDTCLKREMNGVALLVAVASFGWLAFLSMRLYGADDENANRKMLKEYQKRRKLMA